MLPRDDQEISQIIETGLEAILSGTSSVEDVLKQHPDIAPQIRSELEAAMWLVSQQRLVAPRPGFMPASKKRLMERIHLESASHAKKHGIFGFVFPPRFAVQFAAVMTVLLLLFVSMTGVAYASNDVIPGDTLYPAKRFGEQVVFTLAFDPVRQIELGAMFAVRRMDEAEQLVQRGDYNVARAVLEDYEEEVQRVTALLKMVAPENAAEMKAVAAVLQQTLAEQSNRLEVLALTAPEEIQDALIQAQETSALAVEAALETVTQNEPAGTDTPFVVETATDTPVGEQTEEPPADLQSTPVPSNVEPSDDGDPDDGDDPTNPKVKTPKPTNENRPTKDPDPSSKGNDPPGLDKIPTPKPGK